MRFTLMLLLAAHVACRSDGTDGADFAGKEAGLRSSPDVRPLPADVPFPEGVVADRQGRLYVGSLTTGAVARFDRGSDSGEVWLAGGRLERGAIGLAVDDWRNILWICDASPFDSEAAALVGFDLKTRVRVSTHPLPVGFGGEVICIYRRRINFAWSRLSSDQSTVTEACLDQIRVGEL